MKEQLAFEELEIGQKYLARYGKADKILDGDWVFFVLTVDKAARTAYVVYPENKNEKATLACSREGKWTHNGRRVKNFPIDVWNIDSQMA